MTKDLRGTMVTVTTKSGEVEVFVLRYTWDSFGESQVVGIFDGEECTYYTRKVIG